MLEAVRVRLMRFSCCWMMDAHRWASWSWFVPELVKQNIGILGQHESMANGILFTKYGNAHWGPTSMPARPHQLWLLNWRQHGDSLDQAASSGADIQPTNDEQVRLLLAKNSRSGTTRRSLSHSKNLINFDGTAQNPDFGLEKSHSAFSNWCRRDRASPFVTTQLSGTSSLNHFPWS